MAKPESADLFLLNLEVKLKTRWATTCYYESLDDSFTTNQL